MEKKKKNIDKRKVIILAIIIILIIILAIVVGILEDNKEKINNNESGPVGYQSIEQILNGYGCELIKEVKSSDKNYSKDLYVKFKYNTIEKEESKRRYYENIISAVAGFLDESYRLIDKDKDLVIEVQKKVTEQGIVSYIYAINGKQNYFQEQESKISLKNYKEDSLTNLEINSNIINNLIQNEWNPKNINFGTKDSTFDKYDIYFDEGIEVRKISGKIYNIVFTNKYQNEIVNGIKVGTSFEEIIQKLGEPTFGNKEGQLIGYKNNDIYVFFSEEEISIYRNEKVDTKEFEELLSKYINKEIDIKEFMNELTYLWPDYSSYTYDSTYLSIRYPLKGLEIIMTADDSKGINIYGNYSNISEVEKYINNNQITANVDENLLYVEELGRNSSKNELLYLCGMTDNNNIIIKEVSDIYGFYLENNKINFVSKDGTRPNITIIDSLNNGFWYTDTKFIYSVKNQGIYLYDLEGKNKTVIVEGNEDYTIQKYEEGIITYDEGVTIQISD